MTATVTARLIAKVVGPSAVTVVALIAFAWFAVTPVEEWWVKLLSLLVLGSVVVMGGWRVLRAGAQGGTDVDYKHGDQRLVVTDLPLGQATLLGEFVQILAAGAARKAIPPAKGRVRGTAARREDIIDGEFVPPGVEVAKEPVKVPEGAAGIEASR